MESLGNTKIKLDPRLWAAPDPEDFGPRTPTQEEHHIESLQLRSLARFSDYAKNVSGSLPEIMSSYKVLQADCMKMAAILSTIPMTRSAQGIPTTELLPTSARRLHSLRLTCYCLLISLAFMSNGVLRRIDPSNLALKLESDAFVDESIIVAHQAAQYRPLGSSAVPICLISAWVATEDAARQARLLEVIAGYNSDFTSVNWLDIAVSLKPMLQLDVA